MFARAYHEWLHDFLRLPVENHAQYEQCLKILRYISKSISSGKTPDEIKNSFSPDNYLDVIVDERLKAKMVDRFDTLNDLEIMGVSPEQFGEFYNFVKKGVDDKISFVTKKLEESRQSISLDLVREQ